MNELLLYGTVGASWWEEEFFTALDVREFLAQSSGPLTVRINSGGGMATEGQAIYAALRSYDGPVHVVVEGIAASAASLIAMAGDRITMTSGSLLMIHDPATWAGDGRGTEDDHLQLAKVLGVIATAYAGIYAKKAGISVDAAREVMRAETYFDGLAAVAAGFATDTEDEGEAAQVAAFDYRIYQHAPARLLTAAGALSRQRPRETVLAMMAGAVDANGKKEIPMPKTKVKAATAAMQEDDQTMEEDEDLTMAEGDEEGEDTLDGGTSEDESLGAEDEDGSEEDEDGMAEASAPAEALAIYRMCARAGLPSSQAETFIGRGLTCVQALAELNGKGSKVTTKNHAPRATILRDERDTRRRGMSDAIVARMSGQRDVSGPARQFMALSMIEMIAAEIGHRGPLRSPGERHAVLMAASHTTSDFPAIFENALNKQLLDRYQAATPTYRAIAKKKNFRDLRPMSLVRAGDFPMLKQIGENGEIKWGTFGEGKEVAVIGTYGVGLTITEDMLINDDLGAIDEVLSSYGEQVALFEEQTFYAGALSAQMSDGKAIFHADHGNLAATAAAITVASVSAGRSAMVKQKSVDGNAIMGNEPTILLTGPDKMTEAEQFLADITPANVGDVNIFSRRLKPLMTTQITGNAWYLLSERNPNWVYGYLDGMEAPRLRTQEPFGTLGFSMTLTHRFGSGAADYRGGYKNNGA